MRTIEHTETLFEGTFAVGLEESRTPEAIRRFRTDGARSLVDCFVRNEIFFDPMLIAYRSIADGSDPALPPDPRSRYVARRFREEQAKAKKPSADELALIRAVFAELLEVVRFMNRSGVVLLAGSDLAAARIPGFYLHDELTLLVEAGLSPLQALQAATLNPAKALRKTDDYGTVEPGRVADLVLLDADPLASIENVRKISAVVSAGRLWRRADLDALLRRAEELANRN